MSFLFSSAASTSSYAESSSPNPFLSCFICKPNRLRISATAAAASVSPNLCCFVLTLPTAWLAEARACPSFHLIIFANCLKASAMAGEENRCHWITFSPSPRSQHTGRCCISYRHLLALPSACFAKFPGWYLPLVWNLGFSEDNFLLPDCVSPLPIASCAVGMVMPFGSIYLFLPRGVACRILEILVPDQGLNPCLWQWVLTNRLPGKSLPWPLFSWLQVVCQLEAEPARWNRMPESPYELDPLEKTSFVSLTLSSL